MQPSEGPPSSRYSTRADPNAVAPRRELGAERERSSARPWFLVPLLLAASLAGTLISPSTVLVGIDQIVFHLPLRTALQMAGQSGELLQWNPGIHAGQPVLSNPNYAAFYPLTWLFLWVPVHYSINLLVLGHLAWSFLGGRFLLRRLGCRELVALFGATGLALGPWFLSLSGNLNTFIATSWWPWALAFGLRGLHPDTRRRERFRSLVLSAACLALQLIAGDPVTVLLTALSISIVGLTIGPRWDGLRRLVVIGSVAGLLAAVQLLPTVGRVLDSPRSGGLESVWQERWSTPPERLAELLLPHLWGDIQRDGQGLYFGRALHDRGFPYLPSLYVGLPLLLLAVGAVTVPIPYRKRWLALAGLGIVLALGRHVPGMESVWSHLPLFGTARYPERFLVVTAAAICVLGALVGEALWRDSRRIRTVLIVISIVGGAQLLILAAAWIGPDWVTHFLDHYRGYEASPVLQATSATYWTREVVLGFLVTAATGMVLLLTKLRPAGGSWGPRLLLLLLCVDLAHHSQRSLVTLPRDSILSPPPGLAEVPPGSRLTSLLARVPSPSRDLRLRTFDAGSKLLLREELYPYSANLWNLSYALNSDFDLMATTWARHALKPLDRVASDPEWRTRLLEAWSVDYLMEPRSRDDLVRDLEAGRPAEDGQLVPLPHTLSRARFPRRVTWLRESSEALPWLEGQGLEVQDHDACVAPWAEEESWKETPSAEVERLTPLANGDLHLRYRSDRAALLVVADTYHPDRRAMLANDSGKTRQREILPTCPTALGQTGIWVPAGRHQVALEYRDRWVPIGGAITLFSLFGLVWIERRRRRDESP